ncbi:hypothetical protein BFS35_003095 [Macrococcoides goetzii]|uniref:Toxoflavin-degrading enzyme domain-containing protein n=1 Tax=Macrococcoides goetzii TaxID=1891097 RepID=A0A2G5NSR0_9STAP|nr:hypothetical protein [Macrococcus goetzii]RAI82686.1 hypothetical protein BFS35_003095 [Macrococcus goetzii]
MNILSIHLLTKEIHKLKEFYSDLGFKTEIMENKLIVHLIKSDIIFENDINKKEPFYHFAIDIPPNHYNFLKKKISGRVCLLTEDDKDEIYFDHISAKSFYINDSSGNIVEFIARNDSDCKNSINNRYIRISEISLVTNKVNETFKQLENYKFRERDNELIEEGLNFICSGEEKEYILLTKERRRWLFSDKLSKSYPIQIVTDEYMLNYLNNQLEIKKRGV